MGKSSNEFWTELETPHRAERTADPFGLFSPSNKCLTELGESGQRRLSVGGAIELSILDFRFWILD